MKDKLLLAMAKQNEKNGKISIDTRNNIAPTGEPDDKIGRFAVSVLNRYRMDEALPYEVLIDHDAGFTLVKDSQNNVMSQSITDALKLHVNDMATRCINHNIFGEVLTVVIDGKKMPVIIQESVNILDPRGITMDNVDRLFVSFDIDSYNLNKTDITELTELEPSITIKCKLSGGTLPGDKTVVFTKELRAINSRPIIMSINDYKASGISVHITEIQIKRNASISSADELRLILNSILICYV